MKAPGTSETALETLIKSLNPPQRDAAETLEGPLLILAGAGSGKTRVLTFRAANLVAKGLTPPDGFLAVTFTNKAAREMENRILALLKKTGTPVYERLWISTFHSICARILREHIHLLGYKPFFGIYDSADQLSLVKKVCAALGIDEKIHPAKGFAARINAAKTDALNPSDLQRRGHNHDEKTIAVYTKYEHEMKRANSLDFGDLLMKTYQLFCDYPVVLEGYQNKFRYIMVDEYQDTNRIQYLLVQKLGAQHRNLCVVGDEDQSIYSWRGADINNILDFEKDFKDAKVVKLEQNYRSTQTIINAATQVIRHNTQRKDKTLFTENPKGDPIIVREENNEYDEARFVVGEIQTLLNSGEFAAKDIAIFYRTNAQSRVLEEQFRTRGLQYTIVGGIKFYDRMEVKDVLGYMKLIMNPSDDISFKRIVNVPARGVGKTTVDRLEEFASAQDLSMVEACALAVDQREFNAGTTGKLRGFLNILESLREKARESRLPEVYHAILDQTQYVTKLKEEDTPEAESRIENLEELDNAIAKFAEERAEEGTLQTFLEEMALVSDQDAIADQAADPANKSTVTMMTLHISKGLEYPAVFIVGMEEGLFPSGRADEANDPTALEEERRLAYVGMTRAEKKLTLTYARTRKVWGVDQQNPPSRFLKELPKEGVVQQTNLKQPRFMDRMRARESDFDAGDFDSTFPARAGGSRPVKHPLMSDDAVGGMPNYEDFGDDSFDAEEGGAVYKKGMRVRHPTFGVGSIFQVEGNGPDVKVSVVFGDKTVKKFVAKYARLERV
jgi:DNA helicase-2/ATP-dependent DNA helicase PcrA